MNERNGVTRRTLLSATAAAGAVGLTGDITLAQAPPAGPASAAGEYLIRDAYVLSMDAAIGDLPHGDIHVRNGAIVAVGTEGDDDLAALSDAFLTIPDVPELVQPLLAVVPLQLLAYHVARIRGCDIDKPRNLAKSVTVE